MRITPHDIRHQQFSSKMLKGYDPHEVDAFLDDVAEEMKAAARREAELIVREAELRAEKVLEAVRGEEARIRTEIHALRRMRRQVFEDVASTLERYQRLLASE